MRTMNSVDSSIRSSKRSHVHYVSPPTVTGRFDRRLLQHPAKTQTRILAAAFTYGKRGTEVKSITKSRSKESVLSSVTAERCMITGLGTSDVCTAKNSLLPHSFKNSPAKGPFGKYLNTNMAEGDSETEDRGRGRWNSSFQALRLEKERNDLNKCRTMKKNLQMKHRVDSKYVMNGAKISLKPRYHVDDEEMSKLRELSRTSQAAYRKDSSSRTYKRSSAGSNKSQNREGFVTSHEGVSGFWASECFKAPVENEGIISRERNSSSAFDKSMKGRDGEGNKEGVSKDTDKDGEGNGIQEAATDKDGIHHLKEKTCDNKNGLLNTTDKNGLPEFTKENNEENEENKYFQNIKDDRKCEDRTDVMTAVQLNEQRNNSVSDKNEETFDKGVDNEVST